MSASRVRAGLDFCLQSEQGVPLFAHSRDLFAATFYVFRNYLRNLILRNKLLKMPFKQL
jgi:hypothetical protein